MIKKSALKRYSKKEGIKLSKKAESFLLKNINGLIQDVLILSSKEALFKGRRIVSEKDIALVFKKIKIYNQYNSNGR